VFLFIWACDNFHDLKKWSQKNCTKKYSLGIYRVMKFAKIRVKPRTLEARTLEARTLEARTLEVRTLEVKSPYPQTRQKKTQTGLSSSHAWILASCHHLGKSSSNLDGFLRPLFEAEWYLEEVDLMDADQPDQEDADQEDADQEDADQEDKGPGVPEV